MADKQMDGVKSVPDENALFRKAYHSQMPTNPECPNHIHFQAEIVLVTDGTVFMTVAGKSYKLVRGQALLVCPFETHSYRGGENGKCIILEFFARTVSCFRETLLHSIPKNRLLTLPDDIFRFSVRALTDPSFPEEDLRIGKTVLYPLVYSFVSQTDFTERNFDKAMLAAVTMVYDASGKDITLTEVAKATGIRPETLSRKFMKTTGFHFKSFVNALRVDRAIELIGCGRTMTQAAEESGFSSVRTFNRVFRQLTGTTPSSCDASFGMSRSSLIVRD